MSELPGAVREEGVVVHFGDPLREQRALAAGRALVPLDDRAVLALSGPDRLGWLDSITSQSIARLQPGASTELLVLDPQGHVEHAAAAIDDGETLFLIVDRDDLDPLSAWLLRMRFRAAVEIAPRPDLAVVGGSSPVPDALVSWEDPWTRVSPGGWQYAHVDPHPGAERRWVESVLPAPVDLGALMEVADLVPAGTAAAEALRIAAWRPRWARERDGRLLPHEVDWLRSAVHLDKGCYRGQETVAKVHNLGHPPRRLVFLHFDGALPPAGAELRDGDEVRGTVTSAAWHHELGPIGLALVSRRTPLDATLTADSPDGPIAAAQEEIVPADAGATANVPRLTRLSRRR